MSSAAQFQARQTPLNFEANSCTKRLDDSNLDSKTGAEIQPRISRMVFWGAHPARVLVIGLSRSRTSLKEIQKTVAATRRNQHAGRVCSLEICSHRDFVLQKALARNGHE